MHIVGHFSMPAGGKTHQIVKRDLYLGFIVALPAARAVRVASPVVVLYQIVKSHSPHSHTMDAQKNNLKMSAVVMLRMRDEG